MTMPVPDKTWQFSVNNRIGGTGVVLTDSRYLMLGIVQILTEFPISPWVVTGSSDGSTAGMDSVNRWKPGGTWDITKLNWAVAGSAHSWIVLKQTGLFSTCEICIDLSNALSYYCTIIWGFTGFNNDGTTLNRPTVTTFITTLNNLIYSHTPPFHGYLHGMQSTDGECTRLVFMSGDTPYVFWLLDKVKNPTTGWTIPVVTLTAGGSNLLTVSVLNATSGRLNARIGANNVIGGTVPNGIWMTGEGMGLTHIYSSGNSALHQPNQISGEITLFPIGIASNVITPADFGRWGELYDIWWGPSGLSTASPYGTWPDDGTRRFWSADNIVFPWDGVSLPLVR